MNTFQMSRAEIKARIKAAAAEAEAKSKEVPRLFTLTYDRTKLKSRNPVTRLDYQEKIWMWGTRYPDGEVGLQRGAWFASWEEFDSHFSEMGEFEVQFLDEQASEQAP